MIAFRRFRLLPKHEGWTPYIWLVYLTYFAIVPFLFPAPLWQRAATVAGTVAALAIYFAGHWLSGKRVLWAVGAFLVLGTLYCPINPGATVFFVYGAAFLGEVGEPAVGFKYLGGLLCVVALEAWWFRLTPYSWIPAIVFTALVGAVLIHYTQRRRLTNRLLAAREEAERMAQIAERERIARDLHDLLGHTLSLIILKSELASRIAEKDLARAVTEIRDVERISREALAQVRTAVRGYRSAGIASELRQAHEALRTAGIRVESSVEPAALSPAQESVFAFALREGVTNVVRHAHATVCRLTLRCRGGFCELEIADNGRGGHGEEGSGLSGMRERVEALGGILEREAEEGTLLRIRVPV
jgi:two-component system sensor histidine kinase DesK